MTGNVSRHLAAVLLGCALVATGCGTKVTQVIVTIDAEPGVRLEGARLHLVVLGGAGRTAAPTASRLDRVLTPGAGDPAYPFELALAPLDGDVGRSYSVTATAETGAGAFVGQARIIGGYVDGETLTVRLVLEDACRTVVCGAEETCRAGACVDARVASEADAGVADAGAVDARMEDGGGGDAAIDGGCVLAACPLGCSTTTPTRCAVFVPSNVDPSLFTDAVDVILPAAVDTTACSLALAMIVTQPGGLELCVVRGRDITATVGTTVRVTGSRPLALLASRDIIIDGNIDASARGMAPGPGSSVTGPAVGGNGTHNGLPAGGGGDTGGGGGGFCGAGGTGGSCPDSGGGTMVGGTAGTAVAPIDLAPLRGGSSGGEGGREAGAVGPLGAGGAGGGALQLSAGNAVRLRGVLSVGGGGGQHGRADVTINYTAGGGGGSGGGVLIEAPTVIYESSARVQAIGGGGGSSGGDSVVSGTGLAGSDGQDGFLATDRAAGGTTAAVRYGVNGGRSGGGSALAGEVGVSSVDGSGNGGGGGGGAGCVVVRTTSGALPMNAMLSAPSMAPALRALVVRTD